MEKAITIRFSHIDDAGIVFYPRYFEILSELFVEPPFANPPFAMETRFLKPNILGDEVRVAFDPDNWSFSGRMGDTEHFAVRSLTESTLDSAAHAPEAPAFRSDAMLVSPWATDCSGRLQVSRFFEFLNAAVEQWFPRTLGVTFRDLHSRRKIGMPTVVIRTRCRELPRAGDTVSIWIRPTGIGTKSLAYTCWLLRDGECLLENEQVVVFIRTGGPQFVTIPIPDDIRPRLQEQHVAA